MFFLNYYSLIYCPTQIPINHPLANSLGCQLSKYILNQLHLPISPKPLFNSIICCLVYCISLLSSSQCYCLKMQIMSSPSQNSTKVLHHTQNKILTFPPVVTRPSLHLPTSEVIACMSVLGSLYCNHSVALLYSEQ